VRRPQPLQQVELTDLSSKMISCLGIARERYLRESQRMFASEPWLKEVADSVVKSVWQI
jgi:hypothetical protein